MNDNLFFDSNILSNYNLSREAVILLAASSIDCSGELINDLLERGLIDKKVNSNDIIKVFCTKLGIDTLTNILNESYKNLTNSTLTDSFYIDLAKKLQAIYPKGIKQGSTQYWRGNTKWVTDKLKTFVRKYSISDPEVIIDATKAYVKRFEDDNTYMHILPYFIEKNGISALGSVIENYDDFDDSSPSGIDWTTDLIPNDTVND